MLTETDVARRKLEDDKKTSDARVRHLQFENDELASQIVKKANAYTKMEDRAEDIMDRKMAFEDEVDAKQARISELEIEVQQATDRNASLVTELQQAYEKNASLAVELQQANEKNHSLASSIRENAGLADLVTHVEVSNEDLKFSNGMLQCACSCKDNMLTSKDSIIAKKDRLIDERHSISCFVRRMRPLLLRSLMSRGQFEVKLKRVQVLVD
jgi:chromosome segregation ATPase